jgi:hypothetical protein
MPKIGVEIFSYHATQYLPLVLKNYAWVDKIVVMNYRFNSVEPINDNTEEIVRSFKHPNIIIDKGSGLRQRDIRNKGLRYLDDCDVAFISDADEFIFRKDQDTIIRELMARGKQHKPSNYLNVSIIDYNGDLYHASPERGHLTTVAIIPKDAGFGHLRSGGYDNMCVCLPNIKMHHLGLVFTPEVLSWKAVWESKEENVKLDKVLSDWKVVREVTPPQELLEILGEK